MFGGTFYGLLVYGAPSAPYAIIDPPISPVAPTARGVGNVSFFVVRSDVSSSYIASHSWLHLTVARPSLIERLISQI